MSAPQAIGVDLGGTKLLTGVVDSDQKVHYESRETTTGASEDEVLRTIEEEINEAREKCPDAVAAGLGIPCTIDRERGVAINAVNLEITDVPIRDDRQRAHRAPGLHRQRRQRAPRSPSTASARPRARRTR